MEITEVRVKLVAAKNDKLRAFCSITIDNAFVIRDLKVIEGAKGPFVAMPSRKVTERCKKCGDKNHHRARFCNECGARLSAPKPARVGDGMKLHADIAHPINSGCRELVQQRVLDAYSEEQERATEPGYMLTDNEDFDESFLREPAGSARGRGLYDTEPDSQDDRASEEFEGASAEEEAVARIGVARDRSDTDGGFDLPEASGSRVAASDDGEFSSVGDFHRGGERSQPSPLSQPASLSQRGALGAPGAGDPLREAEPAARFGGNRSRRRLDVDAEPEDNFGEGLFS